MQFGICISIANASLVKSQGWDYIEENAQALLQPLADEWQPPAPAVLSVSACNVLVAASVKLVGPAVDREAQDRYMTRAVERAARLGIRTLVLGSAGARMIPDGFDPVTARRQFIEFVQRASTIASKHNVMIALEALRRGECNFINSLAEARAIIADAGNPLGLRLVFDTYHFWKENEPTLSLERVIDLVTHVHVANRGSRAAPHLDPASDYRGVFSILKRAGYDRNVSVEAVNFDAATIERDGAKVLAFLRELWQAC